MSSTDARLRVSERRSSPFDIFQRTVTDIHGRSGTDIATKTHVTSLHKINKLSKPPSSIHPVIDPRQHNKASPRNRDHGCLPSPAR